MFIPGMNAAYLYEMQNISGIPITLGSTTKYMS